MFFQTLILAAIVAGYHYFCIEIIISTFTSIEHTEKLGVLEAANAYMAFGFMMIIGDVLIHLFIGANTKIELDYNIFKANYAELLKIKEMAIVHKQYEIAQLDVDKRFKALQHEYDNLVKQAQQAQQNKGGNSGSGGNSGGGGGSGTTPPAINPTLDPTKVPNWQKSDIEIKARIQGAPKFWSKMLDNTVTENDINGMIQKANRSTLAGAFGTELASLESQMRGLLDEGIQKWSTDSKAIWEKMVDVKSKFMALYQKHK
jgi:hypothetical protein